MDKAVCIKSQPFPKGLVEAGKVTSSVLMWLFFALFVCALVDIIYPPMAVDLLISSLIRTIVSLTGMIGRISSVMAQAGSVFWSRQAFQEANGGGPREGKLPTSYSCLCWKGSKKS